MKKFILTSLGMFSLAVAEPFQSLEGTVGYIVIEKQGKVENYIVVEDKDGSVKTIKVDKKPSEFIKKTEEEGKK